jgi:hypothetical protein
MKREYAMNAIVAAINLVLVTVVVGGILIIRGGGPSWVGPAMAAATYLLALSAGLASKTPLGS